MYRGVGSFQDRYEHVQLLRIFPPCGDGGGSGGSVGGEVGRERGPTAGGAEAGGGADSCRPAHVADIKSGVKVKALVELT